MSKDINNDKVNSKRLNRLLHNAMNAAAFRDLLQGVTTKTSNRNAEYLKETKPVHSVSSSKVFEQQIYIQPGPVDYGFSIKALAAWGFYGYLFGQKFAEIQSLEEEEVVARKANFLRAHGIENPNGHKAYLDIKYVAAWEAIKDTLLVCPSSGSFALGFGKVLENLRNLEIPLGSGEAQIKIKLFNKGDGKIVPFIPRPALSGPGKAIPSDKLAEIDRIFHELGCEPVYWGEASERESQAFLRVFENKNAMFCATNPMSSEQVEAVLKEILSYRGTIFLEGKQESLKNMGIIISKDNKLMQCSPIDQGIGGLMVGKLDAVEALLEKGILQHKSYHQPSSGATLAAAAVVSMILQNKDCISKENQMRLRDHYPQIYNAVFLQHKKVGFEVYGCYDPGNPALAHELGFAHSAAPHVNFPNAVNGLASFSRSGESESILKEAARLGVLKDMSPCGHAIMELARAVILVHDIKRYGENAKYPESAGAAGLGGAMQRAIDNMKTHEEVEAYARRLAVVLKEGGIDKVKLDSLLGLSIGVLKLGFIKEAENYSEIINNSNMKVFAEAFIKYMSADLEKDATGFAGQVEVAKVQSKEIVAFMNTGSNGTEKYRCIIEEILKNLQTKGRYAALVENTTPPCEARGVAVY